MRPMKPRPPGSATNALVQLLGEIAVNEGRDRTAGPEIAAAFEGVSVSLVHKASDPDQPEDLGWGRICRLTRHFHVRAAAEHLALLAGGLFVPVPSDGKAGRWSELGASAAREFGEAMGEIVTAIADGEIDRREGERLVREIDDVLRVFSEMRGLAMAAAAGEPSRSG